MKTPHGKNIVVFDLEIKNPIENGITWTDHHLMGVSVGVLFDYLTSEFRVYMDDNIEELTERLNAASLVSGFNIKGFDIPLLNATKNRMFENHTAVYDLLEESRRAWGWNESKRYPTGMKLDDHLLATFGPEWVKTAHGSEAPRMFQTDRMGQLVSYCIDDVRRECKLFEEVFSGRPVKTPEHGWRVLRHPIFQ